MTSQTNLKAGLIILGIVIILFIIALLVNSAQIMNNISSSFDAAGALPMAQATPMALAREAAPAADNNIAQQGNLAEPIAEDVSRVILKNASLTITVENPLTAINDIAAMAEEMGGWVVSSSTTTFKDTAGEDATRGTITVRVPAERLTEALDRIKSGAGRLDAENITGQDVTQEYVDLSSRLANLQTAEDQLQSIMTSATKVEDVLAVQRELTNVRSEIEIIEGRLKYFNEAAAFSAISVTVNPFPPNPVQSQSAGWNPLTTAESALGTLIQIAQFLVDAAITILIVGGPLLLIIIVSWWGIRRRQRADNSS